MRRSVIARAAAEQPYFLSAILRGLASAFFAIERCRTPFSSFASMRSPSAMSGSEKLRENEPN